MEALIGRSELTIDVGAVRRNAKTLLGALAGAELWAVVKADGYGHGAVDVAAGALGGGASGLCTATVALRVSAAISTSLSAIARPPIQPIAACVRAVLMV